MFFRAGSLGALEEVSLNQKDITQTCSNTRLSSQERDKLVIKWVRFIQGEALKRIRGAVYQKKYDQRELIKVGQRNFRKFLGMRDWGWFIIIQKTRGLIGLPNPQEELEQLEARRIKIRHIQLKTLICFFRQRQTPPGANMTSS